jgi:IS30 family transposase
VTFRHVYYLLKNTTMSQKAIAEMMGVAPSTISRVANRKTHQERPRRSGPFDRDVRGARGEHAGNTQTRRSGGASNPDMSMRFLPT